MAAMSLFRPISRIEFERSSARILVLSDNLLRLSIDAASEIGPAFGVTRADDEFLLVVVAREEEVARLRELEEEPDEELLLPCAAPTRSFRVPESSTASAYSKTRMLSASVTTWAGTGVSKPLPARARPVWISVTLWSAEPRAAGR